MQAESVQVGGSGGLLSLSPQNLSLGLSHAGALPDLHSDCTSCGGPALPPVQVPTPALAMTLAASSQRSQIIRSKFRSGERLLSVHVEKGLGNTLTLGVCTAQ